MTAIDEATACQVEVDGVPMSAIMRQVAQPRAVVVALHGGAAKAAYFHYPGHPEQSLLDTGAALGYTVIALDRPGYGASAPYCADLTAPADRVALAYRAVDALLGDGSRGAGLFLLGHSAGCELAIRMAAARDVLGLEISGTGRHFRPAARDALRPERRPAGWLHGLIWDPVGLYPEGVVGGTHFLSPGPAYESDSVPRWAPRDFAIAAAQVRVPVRYTIGDHDNVWPHDREAMSEVAALFSGTERMVTAVQTRGGHNLSVGLTAKAYHLAVLAFLEECVAAQRIQRGR
ncbi:MAG TPA: alpha/beta hydrolase [Pseudonocardiaceae bacterium]|nr:alpha/beta hydrolase [Pseudonocardiaceae bacterium]